MVEVKNKKGEAMERFGKNAKKVYSAGIRVVKDSFKGMEVVAGKTMEVTKLNLKNQKNLRLIESLFSDLGQRVYNIALNQKGDKLPLTPDIISFIDQITRLRKQVEQTSDKLKSISTVSK